MILHHVRRALFAAAVIGFSAFVAAPASADQDGTQLAQSGAAYDDATLVQFAGAAKEIVALRQKYEPALQSAPNETMANALIEEARNLMDKAITDSGMSRERYLEIATAAQTDPALRERIGALLEQ
jgi:hypothetical protein